MHPTKRNVRLSVILVIGAKRQRAERALATLLEQDGLDAAEIIVVDARSSLYLPIDGARQAHVKYLPLTNPAHMGILRALGAYAAQGHYVAFVEEHVEVLPGWITAILGGFEHEGWSCVGAEVCPGGDSTSVTRALDIFAFLPWLAPTPSGPKHTIPAHNGAYQRQDLLALSAELPDYLLHDSLLNDRLYRQGRQFGLAPGAAIRHYQSASLLKSLVTIFSSNRSYTEVRRRLRRWPWHRGLLSFCYVGVLPFVQLWRLFSAFFHRADRRGDIFVASLPYVLLLYLFAAAGQFVGHVLPVNSRSALVSTLHELELERCWF